MFYLGLPQYEDEKFWAYIDRLKQFLDSLDNHGFSEQELRLTVEKGINCQIRSLLDSLCDGDLSCKSDDEAYDLFDWLYCESRKPNFSLLLSIEESTLEVVGEELVDVSEVMDIDEIEDVLEGRLEIEVEKPFEQVEVNIPSFEDESCTPFEDISITLPTSLTTPINYEDAIFEDYTSESDEESIMFEELEIKWDDEYHCEEVLETWDVEVDLIKEPILENFDVFTLDDDESLGPIDSIDLIFLDPLLEIMFDDEESVSTDCEGDCVVYLLGEPIFERFEASFCDEDEFPIPICDLDLISYAPLLEVLTFDVEYDAPFLDNACMIDLLETPPPLFI